MKDKESLISRQERAAKQQELLEKKRRAKAEYNSTSRTMRKSVPVTQKKVQISKTAKEKKQAEYVSKEAYSQAKKMVVSESMTNYASVSQWFLSICWLNIPVIGLIYALILAINPKTPYDKKNFARGYLLYQILVLFLSFTIMYVLYQVGLSFIEEMLSYVK